MSETITAITIAAAIIIILAVVLITIGGQTRARAKRITTAQARNPALRSRFIAEAPKSDSVAP